ncbi:MAG: outer rane receptor for ferrienterochelin and colicin [Pedosphaera sp.]|nr:outer rane receptor for ferrienterochelin and colicin [Pedosphaera sp.]
MNKLCRARHRAPSGVFSCPHFLRRALFLLVILFAVDAVAAESQTNLPPADLTELPLDALLNLDFPKVYAASKVEQKITQAPASITIVTEDEIKKYGYRTLADVLQSVQGFSVSNDRNYAFLGARGVSLGDFNDRVLLLVDGHRVNNNFNDGAAIGTDFILDIDLVERVEVIRGPSAVLYGNNAFFGVINVITRRGGQINGLETSFDYGSFDTYKGRATFGKQFTNGVDLLLSGTIYESGGADRLFYKEFNYPQLNNGVAQDLDGDAFRSVFGSLGYTDITIEGAFNHRTKTNPTGQFSVTNQTPPFPFLLTTFNDSRLRTVDDRGYGAVKFAHDFPDVVDVTAQLYYDSFTHKIGYPVSVLSSSGLTPLPFSSEKDMGEWWGAELQLNKTIWERHVLTLGGEYRDDFRQEQNITGQTPIMGKRQSHGVYAQGDFELLSNLHFNGGVRYDQYGSFAPAFDPRTALIYNPFTNSTLKAIYGTAFRAPSFYEIGLAGPQLQLKPEKVTSYELVYEQGIGKHLRSSVSGFYNRMSDLIVFTSGSFANFNAQTKGVEVALEGFWPSGLSGRASYSFQHTRNDSVTWQVPDSPNHLLKLDLSMPLVKDKLFADLEFQYTSDRRSLHNTTDSSGNPVTVQGQEAGGYGIVNFTLFSRNLIKNLEVSASIYNLLDERYSDPASSFHVQDTIEQDGRTFRVKLAYHF